MSDPSSLMAGATGISAMGNLMQGQSQSNAMNFNANISNQNAAIAIDQGNAAALQQGVAAQRKIGTMIAGYGASGVSMDAGSPLDVIADSTRSAVLDQQITKYNYGLRAMGLEQTAALDQVNASSATTSSYLNAGSSILAGSAKAWSFSQGGGGNSIPNYGLS